MAPKVSKTPRHRLDQLTVRGFDASLESRLRELARERDLSLNRAALLLMRRGAGLTAPAKEDVVAIGRGLDRFIGLWSRGDESELLEAVAPLNEIDPGLWQ